MSQRTQILAEIWGYRGWNVIGVRYENGRGERLRLLVGVAPPEAIVVLVVERRWAARCAPGDCGPGS